MTIEHDVIVVNSPWTRIPHHAADPGYGDIPPESNIIELVQIPAFDKNAPTVERIFELHARIEELEIELKNEKRRCNNLEIIAKSAQRDKRIALERLAKKNKIDAAHKKYDKLSNDDVMEKLRTSGFFIKK